MRIIFVFASLTLFSFIYSQNLKFPDGPLLSLKLGYHTKDKNSSDYYSAYNPALPGGVSADLSAEVPLGKGWYLGATYDISFGEDEAYDSYLAYNISRTFTLYSFDPIIKYRVFLERSAIYLAIGIGSTKVVSSYSNSYGGKSEGCLNFVFKLGYDFAVNPNFLVSAEAGYLGFSEIKFEGSARSNRFFQFKTGISYVFKNTQAK